MRTNSFKAWFLGIRPNSFCGAALPVIVAAAFAWADSCFHWVVTLLCLLFALFAQTVTNLINEYCDFHNGMDKPENLSPDRMYARGFITPRAMKIGILVSALGACGVGMGLLFYGGWALILIGLACLLAAYLYTAGPFPLAYHGLGDIAVVLFFGIVPTCTTYYIQSGCCPPDVICAAVACGLVVDTMLMLNNFRDRDEDRTNGKRSIVVLLGAAVGKWGYLFLGVAAVSLCALMLLWGRTWGGILPLLYLIPFLHTWRSIVRIDKGPELDLCFASTARNIVIFGILLTTGILLGA